MIDSHKTGAYIYKLRRERDWTQQELAARLHVTPQAVSHWETGDSFPDIAQLVKLAYLFHTSVDDLLHGGRLAPTVRSSRASAGIVAAELIQNQPENVARMVIDEEVDIDTVIEVGSLFRPSMLDQVFSRLAGLEFTAGQLIAIAPYIGPEVLEMLLNKVDTRRVDMQLLANLAPFLGEDRLETLFRLHLKDPPNAENYPTSFRK